MSSLTNPSSREDMRSQHRQSNRILLGIGLLALALVVVASLLTMNRSEQNFKSGTPEATVQAYLKAAIDGKNELAISYLTSMTKCTADDLDRTYISDSMRISLLSSEIQGESAFVKIDAEYSDGGPFGSGYSEGHSYRLAKESGQWRILGIPWPLYDCGVVKS